jgi:hypothetical protein
MLPLALVLYQLARHRWGWLREECLLMAGLSRMMAAMKPCAPRSARPAAHSAFPRDGRVRWVLGAWFLAAMLGCSTVSLAQVAYIARFGLERQRSLLGEPVFCTYTVQNTGAQPFQFPYRSPSRVLNRELEQEPQFRVTDAAGRRLSDPAPKPCGGALGTVVYGFVMLAPGQSHTERWLLNQWARFSSPGRYHVRAERRLPVLAVDPLTQKVSEKPAAYALTLDELTLEVEPANEERLQAAFQPYAVLLRGRGNPNPAEAALVVTTLPQPFLLPELQAMASAPSPSRWDRKQALEGLARLGTPAAWEAILKVAESRDLVPGVAGNSKDVPLRAYATLLLAEKGDSSFLPALLAMLSAAPEELRGDILRALGFFHDRRAYQALFEKLHSPTPADRTNAILGLKNLGTKECIPAVMAMLNDPEAQVRQVANFALESLTGQKFTLSGKASPEEPSHVAGQWHAWWREKGASFVPTRPLPCHDW